MIPELIDLEKILWSAPNEIEEAEQDLAVKSGEFYKQDKLLRTIFSAIVNEYHNLPTNKAEHAAYASEDYKNHILLAASRKSEMLQAEAKLNGARNRFRSAEILVSLYQSKMKFK